MQRNLLLLIGAVTAGGCAPESESVNGGVQQGLSFFTSTPDKGVSGMYAKGELVVFFETLREVEAEPAPTHEHFALDGSAINVSARFTDMEGRNLLVTLDRHDAPTAWVAPGELSEAMRVLRPALFDLTLEAGLAIKEAELDAAVTAEVHALVVTGVNMRPPVVDPPVIASETYYSGDWNHWQYFEIRSADLDIVGISEHSAAVFWNYSETYGWEDGWQSANHGRYATEMGVDGDCAGGRWTDGGRPHYGGERLQSCDMKNGYAVCGGITTAPWSTNNHNCHDDTKVQRENILRGSWFSSAPSWCSGWGCDTSAPSC